MRVDLGARADVDAARRVVEEQHRRVGDEPAGDLHLLLVAAAERSARARRSTGARMRSCRDPVAAPRRACAATSRKAPRREPAEAGQHHVVGDRVDRRPSASRRSWDDEPDARARSRRAASAIATGAPSTSMEPLTRPRQAPNTALPTTPAARADEPEQADDLAAARRRSETSSTQHAPGGRSRVVDGQVARPRATALAAGCRRARRGCRGDASPRASRATTWSRVVVAGPVVADERAVAHAPGCGRRWRTPRTVGATRTRRRCRARGRLAGARTGGRPRHRSAPRSARRGSAGGPACAGPGRSSRAAGWRGRASPSAAAASTSTSNSARTALRPVGASPAGRRGPSASARC